MAIHNEIYYGPHVFKLTDDYPVDGLADAIKQARKIASEKGTVPTLVISTGANDRVRIFLDDGIPIAVRSWEDR